MNLKSYNGSSYFDNIRYKEGVNACIWVVDQIDAIKKLTTASRISIIHQAPEKIYQKEDS